MKMAIPDICHPDYDLQIHNWFKWRATFVGGDFFMAHYLRKLSKRETNDDYADRKAVSYVPAFAKSGVREIIDSIYQRMPDIIRAGGSPSYQSAVSGVNGGVDLEGSSMNYFMGCVVLPELLTMGKVGIYVDMPPLRGPSEADNVEIRPYVYAYCPEDIRCWTCDEGHDANQYASILLQEYANVLDEETGFPVSRQRRYRRVWREADGLVMAAFYNEAGQMVDQFGNEMTEPIPLNVDRVPFVCVDISESLLTDVADYQISMLNLASTDVIGSIKAGFPIYVEQYEPRAHSTHLRTGDKSGEGAAGEAGSDKEVAVGPAKGRRYPKGMERPGFINPSSEPLVASMDKQQQMKEEIRQLLRLTVANLKGPKMASADSKKEDSRTLEAGLSYIGFALQQAETKVAELWAMYEGRGKAATVVYPEDYSLKSDADRREEASSLLDQMQKVPSATYQKALAKRAARIMLGPKVDRETMARIEGEIDRAVNMNCDPETIRSDCEAGLVDLETASKQRLWPDGVVQKAKADHEERLRRIALSQAQGAGAGAAARGNPDGDPNPANSGRAEKAAARDTTAKDTTQKPVRGEGK